MTQGIKGTSRDAMLGGALQTEMPRDLPLAIPVTGPCLLPQGKPGPSQGGDHLTTTLTGPLHSAGPGPWAPALK